MMWTFPPSFMDVFPLFFHLSLSSSLLTFAGVMSSWGGVFRRCMIPLWRCVKLVGFKVRSVSRWHVVQRMTQLQIRDGASYVTCALNDLEIDMFSIHVIHVMYSYLCLM
ncbi:hypothetical protein QQ045_027964 [Rhodiola kirilowii]